jgi:alpha-ketoglutarate-dependent taurine dioxygenase
MKKPPLKKELPSLKPKVTSVAPEALVNMAPLSENNLLPLVVTPMLKNLDLAGWAASNRDMIQANVLKHGAVLFRGFGIDSVAAFERFALSICSELFKENAEHTPVNNNGNVQTPVFYSPAKKLLWHNENSFNHEWPLKIMFCCVQPAQQGGETPLVDSRKVFEQINPAIRQRFLDKQVMYMRNYSEGLGLTWQTVFRTHDRAEVEAYCRARGIDFEWKDGDQLRTRQIRPAAIAHPQTGEMSWFNQAQHWHVSCLDEEIRSSLTALYREEDLPRNCYYGDGSPIEDAAMAHILEVYQELEVSFPWQQGDVIVVDNVFAAHGRNAFVGPRKLLVSLAEMSSYAALS